MKRFKFDLILIVLLALFFLGLVVEVVVQIKCEEWKVDESRMECTQIGNTMDCRHPRICVRFKP